MPNDVDAASPDTNPARESRHPILKETRQNEAKGDGNAFLGQRVLSRCWAQADCGCTSHGLSDGDRSGAMTTIQSPGSIDKEWPPKGSGENFCSFSDLQTFLGISQFTGETLS